MNVSSEVITFFAFIVSGMLGGVAFDLFRAIRKNFETSNVVVYIEDFIFWILLGAISLMTSYFVSDGQIRVYMLISMVMGAIIYFFSIGKLIYKVFDFICRYLSSIIGTISKFIKEDKNEAKVQNT